MFDHITREYVLTIRTLRAGQWIGALIGLVLGLWLAFTVDGPARWYLVFVAVTSPAAVIGDFILQNRMFKRVGFNRDTAVLMCTIMAHKDEIGDESPTDWPEII